MRTLVLPLVVAPFAIVVLALTACSTPDPGPGGPTAASPSDGGSASSSPAPASSDLAIVVSDGTAQTTWTLTCDPSGGSHPDPAAACAALADGGATALPPVAKDTMCTQVYGGPETASVTGTWRGSPVRSTFSRTDGCEIARWNRLKGLLPSP